MASSPNDYMQAMYPGSPQYPGYNPIYDPSTMALAPQFQQTLNGITPDQTGLDAFEQSALRTGPSPWATAANAASYQDQALSADKLTKNNASDVATANSNMAMQGGTRSGSKERVATSGNTNLMQGEEGLQGTGMQNRSQITINDEQNRIAQLGQLPGMQMQQAQFGLQKATAGEAAKAVDVGNQMNATQSLNQYNMGMYNTQAQMYGANQQANATMNSGSSSWVCSTAAAKASAKYSRDEQRALVLLRRFSKEVDAANAHFYFNECGTLISKMVFAGIDWDAIMAFVKRITLQIISGDLENAYKKYVGFIRESIEEFWPGCTHPAYTGVN